MSDVKIYPVTDDRELAQQIIDKIDEATDHFEVEEFAHSLGLYPPWWKEGDETTIGLYWPPGTDPSTDEGVPVWGLEGLPEQADGA